MTEFPRTNNNGQVMANIYCTSGKLSTIPILRQFLISWFETSNRNFPLIFAYSISPLSVEQGYYFLLFTMGSLTFSKTEYVRSVLGIAIANNSIKCVQCLYAKPFRQSFKKHC